MIDLEEISKKYYDLKNKYQEARNNFNTLRRSGEGVDIEELMDAAEDQGFWKGKLDEYIKQYEHLIKK